MIRIVSHGDFKKTKNFLEFVQKLAHFRSLDYYGRQGVEALSSATPVDTGLTASSWDYEITRNKGRIKITWINSNITERGTPIAILIQYGHGTKSGAWVEGYDYINPALRPVFDEIANSIWQEVISV